MNEFVKPTIEYFEIAPMLIVFGVAVVGVLVEAFLPRKIRYPVQLSLVLLGLVGAFAMTVVVAPSLDKAEAGDAVGIIGLGGTLVIDGPTVFLWGLTLLLAFSGALLFAERRLEGGVSAFAAQAAALPGTEAERQASSRGLDHTEVYPLLMFAVGGMMLFPAANDLLTMFVALEVLSLPLYLLSGLARRRRLLSQEAAMKYFLLGAFSSGFVIYGIALLYGFAGSMQYAEIHAAVSAGGDNRELLVLGTGLVAVGLLFKIGAAPFHAWTPDVYQGAPTAVTGFMAACTKVAAFGALMRLFYVALGADKDTWLPVLAGVAIATMVIGTLLAISQTDMKRMLAYSSIAHAGFILTGVLGARGVAEIGSREISSIQAVLFYLIAYGFSTIGAFAIVTMVRDAGGEATQIRKWQGLGRRSPVVAGTFAFFLLAMTGIPLTSGFIGKWAVFAAAFSAGAWPVVVVAVLVSAVAAYFYVRVIVVMFFREPVEGSATVTLPSTFTAVAITLGVVITLVLGVVPDPVLDLAGQAGNFIR